MQITIRSFEKFNGRKDIKRPWWFKLSNTILEDSDLFGFTGDEFKAWIYIMSQASKHQSATIDINLDHADRVCGIPHKSMKSAVEKLIEKNICTQSVRDPYVIRTQSVQQTRLEEIRLDKNIPPDRALELYNLYPRKEGKKRGLLKLKLILATEGTFDKIRLAIENYLKSQKDPRFYKHFDTFIGCWEDYLDPIAKPSLPKKQISATVATEIQHDHTNKEEVLALLRGAIKTL